MAKLVISEGIALVNLSRRQRRLLDRPYIAFELGRIVAVYKVEPPKRSELGQRKTRGFRFWKTGGYIRGVKRVLYVKGSGKEVVRILLLNPTFDEVYLQFKSASGSFEVLAKNAKNRGLEESKY